MWGRASGLWGVPYQFAFPFLCGMMSLTLVAGCGWLAVIFHFVFAVLRDAFAMRGNCLCFLLAVPTLLGCSLCNFWAGRDTATAVGFLVSQTRAQAIITISMHRDLLIAPRLASCVAMGGCGAAGG